MLEKDKLYRCMCQNWLFNSINTRENCFLTCLTSWINNEPLAYKHGKLNKWIYSDEGFSGPIFSISQVEQGEIQELKVKLGGQINRFIISLIAIKNKIDD